MNRFGLAIALLLVFALVGIAAVVHVTGPGWSTGGGEGGSGPQVARAPAPKTGTLLIPVQGVTAAALTDSWSEARGGGTRAHHAIDIMAPIGTPVVAAADGRIEKLFQSDRGGLTIYERSPDRATIYYYAHLDRYAPSLAEGQAIHAGQEIAAVGATGDADPAAPHLHFEVHNMAPGEAWWQGREVNPYPLLRTGG